MSTLRHWTLSCFLVSFPLLRLVFQAVRMSYSVNHTQKTKEERNKERKESISSPKFWSKSECLCMYCSLFYLSVWWQKGFGFTREETCLGHYLISDSECERGSVVLWMEITLHLQITTPADSAGGNWIRLHLPSTLTTRHRPVETNRWRSPVRSSSKKHIRLPQ